MKKLLLAALIWVIPALACAQQIGTQVVPNPIPSLRGGTGFQYYSETQRTPNSSDDTTRIYSANQFWKDQNGNLWQDTVNTAGAAVWNPLGNFKTYPCDAAGGCATAYGIFKVVSAYAGNSFQVTRASDSTTQNIGFISSPLYSLPVADMAAMNAFCAGTTCTVSKIFNQSATTTTDDCTPSAAGAQPPMPLTLIGGYPAFMMNGNFRAQQGSSFGAECTDGSFSESNQAVSFFFIGRLNATGGTGVMVQTGGAATELGRWYVSANAYDASSASGGTYFFANTQGNLSNSADVFGIAAGTSNVIAYYNDQSQTVTSAFTSHTWTSLTLGTDPSLESNHWYADMNWFAFMTFGSQISSTLVTQLKEAAYSAFPIYPQLRENFVVVGTSLDQGWGDTIGQNWPNQFLMMLPKPLKLVNLGVAGTTCQSISTASPDYPALAVASGYNQIISIDCGSNDIFTSITPAATYGYLQTIISNIRSVDTKDPIIVHTMIDRANGSQETNRQALNTLIRTGVANGSIDTTGHGQLYLSDEGGSAPLGVSGNSTSSTYFQTDQIHLKAPGMNVEAAYNYNVVINNNLLR
jgi:hypothetical protein